MLQCVAMLQSSCDCSVLLCVAVYCRVLQCNSVSQSSCYSDFSHFHLNDCNVLKCVAVFYSVLQFVAMCLSVAVVM